MAVITIDWTDNRCPGPGWGIILSEASPLRPVASVPITLVVIVRLVSVEIPQQWLR